MDLALEASASVSAQSPAVRLPGGSVVKSPPVVQETQQMRVRSLSRDDALEESMKTIPAFFPGESQGLRRLAGHSPKGHKQLDATKQLHMHTCKAVIKYKIYQKKKILISTMKCFCRSL